jgi:DnaJ-class molecular chaperone
MGECAKCQGTGRIQKRKPGYHTVACPTCRGTGKATHGTLNASKGKEER